MLRGENSERADWSAEFPGRVTSDFRSGSAAAEDLLVPSHGFETAKLPPKEQFDFYRDELSVFGKFGLPDGKLGNSGFFAKRTGYTVGPLYAVLSNGEAHSFEQTAREASVKLPDHWVLVQRSKGRAEIDFGSNIQRFEGGRLELWSMAKARRGRTSANESMFLVLPRDLFPGLEALMDGLTEADGANFIHPLLNDYLASLTDLLPNITAKEAPAVAEATFAIIRACISHTSDAVAAAQSPIMATHFERAKRYIETKLTLGRLTPDNLCADLGVSRRQLYKIFEKQGGIAKYIRSRRLNVCHAALSASHGRSIAQIAADHGFTDAAQFSRQFRAEFGYNPSEVRDFGSQTRQHSSFTEWIGKWPGT
jgi:AraC-like DNA-binding protein